MNHLLPNAELLALLTGLPGGAFVSLSIVVGSLVICIALFALARTKWGKARPMHRYAAVSLALHLLLLAAASTIRYGNAQAGVEDAEPVKVRIVMSAPESVAEEADEESFEEPDTDSQEEAEPAIKPESIVTEVAEQPPAERPATEPIFEQSATETAEKLEPVELTKSDREPQLPIEGAGQPIAAPTPQQTEVEVASPDELMMPEQPVMAHEPEQFQVPEQHVEVSQTYEPVSQTPAWNSPYAMRGQQQKLRLAVEQGGSQQTEDAVAYAVDWLARAQRPDGAWDATRWGAGREQRVLNHDRGGAGKKAETGLTGLALLAMQGAGYNHLEGPYSDNVRSGLAYLLESQKQDGSLAGEATTYAATYCHSMATFALAEALATTKDDRLYPGTEAAVAYLIRSQSKATGGWRYRPGDRGDMSQMGWVLMALRSAELAGIEVSPKVWNGIEQFVRSVTRGKQGGLAAYQPLAPTSPTMTAEALYCRQILGTSGGQTAASQEAAKYLTDRLSTRSVAANRPINLYYWYYATLALHHHREHDNRAWQSWNDSLVQTLLPLQVAEGQNQGSWTPTTLWGGYGGRVYSTALATMCLEVYYRYDGDRMGRDPWLASRQNVPIRR